MSTSALSRLPESITNARLRDVPVFMASGQQHQLMSLLSRPKSLAISVSRTTPAFVPKPKTVARARSSKAETKARKKGGGNIDLTVSDDEVEEEEEMNDEDRAFLVDDEDVVSEEEDEESDDDDDGEDGEGNAFETADDFSDDSSDEESIIEKLKKADAKHAARDICEFLNIEQELEDNVIPVVSMETSMTNSRRKALLPTAFTLPVECTFGVYTLDNLLRYLLDNAMYEKHTLMRNHQKPSVAILHAIMETRAKLPLMDARASTDSTVLAYKFHLYLAEKLRVQVLKRNFSPAVNAFMEALGREDITDGFFLVKPQPQSYHLCAFTNSFADCGIAIKSHVENAYVATMWLNSANLEACYAFNFARFWFLPFAMQQYVDDVVAPLWDDGLALIGGTHLARTKHYNEKCQETIYNGLQSLLECLLEMFKFMGIKITKATGFPFA